MSTYSRKKRRMLGAGVLLIVFLAGYILLNSQTNLGSPPEWHTIIPGQTSLKEVYASIGEADATEYEANYIVHIYKGRQDLEWNEVKIYVKSDERIVIAISMSSGLGVSPPQPLTLRDIVLQYGKPEMVLWSDSRLARCLLWPSQGIEVTANAWVEKFPWEKNHIANVTYYAPMPPWRVLFSESFGRCSLWNWHYNADGGPRDRFPRDPYDWNHMPQQ